MNGGSFDISIATLVKIIVTFLCVYILYLLLDFLFLLLLSVILASAIRPAHIFLLRFRFPRVLSVILVYISFILVLAVLIYSTVPIIKVQGTAFINTLPSILETLNVYTDGTIFEQLVDDVAVSFETFKDNTISGGDSKQLFSFISSGVENVLGGFVSILLVGILTFLFAVEDKSFYIFFKYISPRKYEQYIFDLWDRSVAKVGAWFQGQLLLALIVGAIAFVGLTILGVPNALFLAIFAGLFELIPVVGPIISIVPAFLIAIVETTPYIALFVVILFLLIQQLENQILLPLVVSKLVGIPTVIVIGALVVGATLGGLLGIIIAIPVTAVLLEFVRDIENGKIEEFVAVYEKSIAANSNG